MANRLAYCKSNGFRLEANPDKQNKTVKIFKMVGSKKMQESDYEWRKTNTHIRDYIKKIPEDLTDKECSEASRKQTKILVAESLNHDAPGNQDIKLDVNNGSHFYVPAIYSNFIVPESKDRDAVINIYGKDQVDCDGGVTDKCNKNPYLSFGGKKSRRKTSKKSHRKSSKKQRKSRRARKSRRGRR